MTAQTSPKAVMAATRAKARSVASKPLPGTSKALTPSANKVSVKAAKKAAAKAPAVKPALKRSEAKTAAKTKVKPVVQAAPAKIKKPKLVRDSFTIPKDEYLALQKLKDRAIGLAKLAKKGELLRGGLLALANMSDTAFLAALAAVPALKTGRPKGAKNS
jgi:hypothetical protein